MNPTVAPSKTYWFIIPLSGGSVRYLVLRACAWLIASAALVMTIVPPGFRPVTGLPHLLEHLSWFFACGMVFGAAYPKAAILNLYIGGLAFCAVLEIMQLWIPGRHARLNDFLADALAITLGLSLLRVLQTFRSRTRPVLSE